MTGREVELCRGRCPVDLRSGGAQVDPVGSVHSAERARWPALPLGDRGKGCGRKGPRALLLHRLGHRAALEPASQGGLRNPEGLGRIGQFYQLSAIHRLSLCMAMRVFKQ